ncbi:MAG: PQQ-binding-like beta-propeller repeat protein [Bacillota bacterium]
MRHSSQLFAGVVSGVLVLGTTFAVAQDWPQWRGSNRDGKAAGFTAPQTWPKTLTQKWKTAVGFGDATPALVGDKLYVFSRQGADEITLCLDAATGKELWRDKYAAQAITGPAARHPGPRSSPAVADGKVVTLGVGGVVSCLDAATGKPLWRNEQYKAVPRFFTSMSPLIVDGLAILQLGGQGNGTIIAFDLASGAEKWKWTGDGPGYSSPVLMTVDGTKLIVTLTEKNAVGLAAADGKLLWQLPFAPQGMSYNAATPIVDGQTVIITGQGRGTKALKIEKQGDTFAPKELWSNTQLAPQFNSPVLKEGFLYGLSDRGNLYCINAQNGQMAWTDPAKLGNFGAIVDGGSVLLALPSNSELIALKPDSKAYTELARYKVAETATYAHPIIAGNRIFAKDQESLVLWTIE